MKFIVKIFISFFVVLMISILALKQYRPVLYKLISNSKIIVLNDVEISQNKPIKRVLNGNLSAENHYEINLGSSNFNGLKEAINTNKKPVLLTVYHWGNLFPILKLNHFNKRVFDGELDENIIQLCEAIDTNSVLIRWNPEMDNPVNKFPWQGKPQNYVKAYNGFASILKSKCENAKLVWGPKNITSVMDFYPGDDMVDYITLDGNSSNENPIWQKIHRLRFTNKPIIVLGKDVDDINVKFEKLSNTEPEKTDFIVGAYEKNLEINKLSGVNTEHHFFELDASNLAELTKTMEEVKSRDHNLFLTLEPNSKLGCESLLDDIINHKYDSNFSSFYEILNRFENQVFVRFAHEMEIPINRYCWQNRDPRKYIKAFRHFVSLAGDSGTIKFVWGPAGDKGLLEFYPGDDVVDIVSLAIFGMPDKNINDYTEQESFDDILDRKLWRYRLINKPILIAEKGIAGPENYQKEWLESAARRIKTENKIVGFCYYNAKDIDNAWGEINPPDWKISEGLFHLLF